MIIIVLSVYNIFKEIKNGNSHAAFNKEITSLFTTSVSRQRRSLSFTGKFTVLEPNLPGNLL